VIKNDGETINEIDAFTRVTSVESKIAIAHLLRFHSMKQSKMHDCLNARTIISSTISFIDRSISLDDQTIREGDHEAIMIVRPYSVIVVTPSSLERES